MGHMSYNKVSNGSNKGFRLNLRKFNVLRLRKRFNFFLRFFNNWKISYGEALQFLKKVFCRKSGFKRNSSSRRSLIKEEEIKGQDYYWKMRSSYGRTNSFYSEAIEDCLEFIKRTSMSSKEHIQDPIIQIHERNSWMFFGITIYRLYHYINIFNICALCCIRFERLVKVITNTKLSSLYKKLICRYLLYFFFVHPLFFLLWWFIGFSIYILIIILLYQISLIQYLLLETFLVTLNSLIKLSIYVNMCEKCA